MADTQRTRAAILNLFADNTTGQISEQDLRDFTVTVMNGEFVNPGDFWTLPAPDYLTTDKTTRGAHLYSQTIDSVCSFGNILALTPSNTWRLADAAVSTLNYRMGIATDSYAAADSTAKILINGLVYNSALSARFSGYIGLPVFLQSDGTGSLSITEGTAYTRYLGCVVGDSAHSTTSSKWVFSPDWTKIGV